MDVHIVSGLLEPMWTFVHIVHIQACDVHKYDSPHSLEFHHPIDIQ